MLAAGGELDADGELLVARHLTASGRSRAFLGGASVPAGLCTDATADLVTIHSRSSFGWPSPTASAEFSTGSPERR